MSSHCPWAQNTGKNAWGTIGQGLEPHMSIHSPLGPRTQAIGYSWFRGFQLKGILGQGFKPLGKILARGWGPTCLAIVLGPRIPGKIVLKTIRLIKRQDTRDWIASLVPELDIVTSVSHHSSPCQTSTDGGETAQVTGRAEKCLGCGPCSFCMWPD